MEPMFKRKLKGYIKTGYAPNCVCVKMVLKVPIQKKVPNKHFLKSALKK